MVQTTVGDYDLSQVKSLFFQTVMGAAIVVFMHLKWGYLRPLLLQSVLGLKTLSAAPIVQVYVLGYKAEGELARPWKAGGGFGGQQSEGPTVKELKAMEKKEAKKKINRID